MSDEAARVIDVHELIDKAPAQGSADQRELDRACIIASLAIEAMCGGTKFVQRSFTEDILGKGDRLYLSATPIVSVTSITDDEGNTVSSTDYTIIPDKDGYLEHKHLWPFPVGRWTVI